MEDLNAVNKRVHTIMMTNRRTCTINGVCDVLSFDKGEVDVDGKIDSLTYSETSGQSGKNESLLTRLFR